MYKHLSYAQRVQLKKLLNNNTSVKNVAKTLGFSKSSIYREISRGTLHGKYDPDYAEKAYRKQLKNKGKKSILEENKELASYIAYLLKEENLSVKQIEALLKKDKDFTEYAISDTTIYKAIESGLIDNVTKEMLRPNTVTVFNSGLISIPRQVLKKLGIKDGDKLCFEITNDEGILLKKHK